MGGTNAVYLLMSINLSEVGKCFYSARSLLAPEVADFKLDPAGDQARESEPDQTPRSAPLLPLECAAVDEICDEDVVWADRQGPSQFVSSSRRSVLEWANEIRRLRREWEHSGRPVREAWRLRTWVILHLFSGPRRDGDIGWWLSEF